MTKSAYLDGQLLIAMPGMGDPRFDRAVILICAHSDDGAMGLIIPAMLIRIANGHTGRKVIFDRLDKAVLWIMIAGFVIRIILPQFDPAGYLRWIGLAAACWFTCFAVLAWRYVPYLLQPRVDGKPDA